MRIVAVMLSLTFLLAGCASQRLENGRYIVQRSTDSVELGTNGGFIWLDECDGKPDQNKPGMVWYNCERKTPYHPVSSPGVLTAMINGLFYVASFGTLGAVMPGGQAVMNQAVNQSVVVPGGGHGHGHK